MFRTINAREVIEKNVVKFGNGSIVYTPKRWIGEKVLVVVLEKKPLEIKEDVIELLKPHFNSIEGAFLYGSFARNEQTSQSDIDVLVIADKKIRLEKKGKFDFLVKTKQEFLEELQKGSSLFLHQIASEAKPIINESLLKELKQAKAKPDFERFFDETLGAFKKTRQLLETNKNKQFLDSNTAIYSLILRLKSLFIIQCYEKGTEFSNKEFEEFMKKHDFSEKTINDFQEAYQSERDERKTTKKILAADAEKLFETAKIEFLKTEEMVKKWAKTNTKKQ